MANPFSFRAEAAGHLPVGFFQLTFETDPRISIAPDAASERTVTPKRIAGELKGKLTDLKPSLRGWQIWPPRSCATAPPMNDFGLVKAIDRFGEGTVIAVTDTSDGRLNPACGITEAEIHSRKPLRLSRQTRPALCSL